MCEFVAVDLLVITVIRNNAKWQNRGTVLEKAMSIFVDLNPYIVEHNLESFRLRIVELR